MKDTGGGNQRVKFRSGLSLPATHAARAATQYAQVVGVIVENMPWNFTLGCEASPTTALSTLKLLLGVGPTDTAQYPVQSLALDVE